MSLSLMDDDMPGADGTGGDAVRPLQLGPQPDQYSLAMPNSAETSELIQASPAAIRDLIKLQFIVGARAGYPYDIPQAEVDRLAAVPYVSGPHATALVVCVDPAVPDNDVSNHREYVGWTPGLDPFAEIQIDGVTQWWPVNDPDAPDVIVVTSNGWILHAYEIDGAPTRHESRPVWRFPVKTKGIEKSKPFVGHRLPPLQGPKTYPLPAKP